MQKGFTLLELIVVIVILGILATLGFTQYTKMAENTRTAEAVVNLGKMRSLAISYYMQNGTFNTITGADLDIGSPGGDNLPSSCDSAHYYWYNTWVNSSSWLGVGATRCTSGGKTPTWTGLQYQCQGWLNMSASSFEIVTYDSRSGTYPAGCHPL